MTRKSDLHTLLGSKPAHYLVTGGAGFIGSALVRELLARGQHVRVVDNFSTGQRKNLEDAIDRIELIEGDLVQPEVCRQATRGMDYVLHQAAVTSVSQSLTDPLATHAVNATSTLNLLLAARDAGCRRFVYASSSAIYGNAEVLPIVESTPPRPRSPYAVSKYAGEQYVLMFHEVYGLEAVALRYFNVFGARQNGHSPYSGVLSRWMAAAHAGEPLLVHGDGQQSRDFVFVDNVVDANLLACTVPDAPGRAINVGGGDRHTLLDVADTLGRLLGAPLRTQRADPRRGDIRHSQADITLANTVLGYSPRVLFFEGLKETFDWWRVDRLNAPLSAEWT